MSLEAIRSVTVTGRVDLPPNLSEPAYCFTDPAGGTGQDSWATAIGHREPDGRVVVDKVVEIRPPFNPETATAQLAEVLRAYRVYTVTGDRYAGGWPASRFAAHGIAYRASERTRSDLYRDCLPILTSGRCELPDLPKLAKQFTALERKTGRSKDTIDSRGHEDVANAVAGLLCIAAAPRMQAGWIKVTGF